LEYSPLYPRVPEQSGEADLLPKCTKKEPRKAVGDEWRNRTKTDTGR
jgi:hypothetical protein